MRTSALVVAGLLLLGCSDEQAQDAPAAAGEKATTSEAPGRDNRPTAEPGRDTTGTSTAADGARNVAAAPPRRHRVLDVVDGDTVQVAYRGSQVSVRIIGIDTPETVHPSEPVECGGPQASATATKLLADKSVRLVVDRSQGRTDSYGRTLAYVHAPGVGDVGLAMLLRGRAAEYTYDTSYSRRAQYLAAQEQARSQDRGIWNRCGGVDKPRHEDEPRQQQRPGQHATTGESCDPGYDPCVPPYPPDLDCADVDGPITVKGDDPHGFDADGDGTGCDI